MSAESKSALFERVLNALPQTQCTRCGYPDCATYASAIAYEDAPINQCPPGGSKGIRELAKLTSQAELALNPANGSEGSLLVAWIDEQVCIGCTLCINACPTDAILGTNKQMHTVIEKYCTGCELCVPVCPVDCIELESVSNDLPSWQMWDQSMADQAKARYASRKTRLQIEEVEHADRLRAKALEHLEDLDGSTHMPADKQSDAHNEQVQRKSEIIRAALERAQKLAQQRATKNT